MLSKIINEFRKKKITYQLAQYDAKRYLENSMIMDESKTQARLLGLITARQHVVEKGLTMPETRLGFGRDNILSMIELCETYEQRFDITHEQFRSAVAVLKEYLSFHEAQSYQLDDDLHNKIQTFTDKYVDILSSQQNCTTAQAFFRETEAAFPQFARGRHTVRNYSKEEVPIEVIKEAIALSQTAPSACNRQPVRVHVCCGNKKEEVMKLHRGNRGFGDRADKVLVITADLSSYMNVKERNCAYVDGGIFTMNLLYALHYHHIGACTLNWSATKEEDLKLRGVLSLTEEEEVVCLICIGMLPDELKIACSERIKTERIYTIHE